MTNKLFHLSMFLFLMSLFTIRVHAQQNITVKGIVKDENNSPLSGVSIYSSAKSRVLGATDNKGQFSITTTENDEIRFQIIGYNSHKVKVTKSTTNLNIVLKSSVNVMEETVVVGYQARTRETMTGSSVIISGKDLQDVPVSNVMELLQGRVAGMNIQNNTGMPGAMGTINIRGVSNVNVSGTGNDAFLTPTTPLFVIDGVPVDNNSNYQYGFEQQGPGLSPLSMIPTEDIEQIEVLKDAQATSLYGSRGAYGVILITTKRGKSKTPIVQYTGNAFLSNPPALRKTLGGRDERLLRIDQIMKYDSSYRHALELINNTPLLADSLNPYYNNTTDWQSYFYRTTFNQTHNVNISGGDELFNYKVNTGLYDEKGIVKNTGFKRYNLNMNMQYQPNRKFKLSSYMNAALGNNSAGSGNTLRQTGIADGSNSSSLLPSPSIYSASSGLLSAFIVENRNKTTNISSNIELQYEPVKDLRASTTFSYVHNTGDQYTFKPAILNDNINEIYSYNDRRNTVYNRNMISYVKSFNDLHTLNVYGFNELNMSKFQADGMRISGTPNDYIQGPIGSIGSLGGTLNNIDDVRSVAFAGAMSYNFDRRYILDLSYRFDGSSTNGTENPYTQNPSLGMRWNFNKEKFMENLQWLSYGSWRVSMGRNIVPTGGIYDVYGKYVGNIRTYNNNPNVSLDLTTIPNTALVPSTTTQLSTGWDIGLFNGKYNITIETYYKQVDAQLRLKQIANHNAFGGISTNETSLVNYGYEFSLMARPLKSSSPFQWTLNFNTAINKDIMASLPDNVRQILLEDNTTTNQSILYRLGMNSLSNILYSNIGVYASDADVPVDPLTGLPYRYGAVKSNGYYFQAGDPILVDLNGDYILDKNDLVIAGNSQPAMTGGISSYMTYRSFSLSINCSYTLYRDILNNALANLLQSFKSPTEPKAYVPIDGYNFWQNEGDIAVYPNPYNYMRYTYFNPNMYNQTLFQEDGSYFKINNMTVGYNFNREKLKRYRMTSLRVYATANNVYTFSNYSGPDPELVTALGRDDSGGYPRSRSYTIGLQIQF